MAEFYAINYTKDNKYYRDKNFLYEEIINIEPIHQVFYDLSIPNGHSFISNGFLSHNTGKSTLVSAIIDELGIDIKDVAFATFTGKASLVLTMKGCPATTIHKLIYDMEKEEVACEDENGNVLTDENGVELTKEEIFFRKKDKLADHIKLIVLDECSMIDQQMLDDVKSFGLPIIVLGDYYQLKPIGQESVLLKNPDVILTEIMRQKENDPIVYLATKAREKQRIDYGQYGKSYVIEKSILNHDIDFGTTNMDRILSNSDIVLCRTNKSRVMLNKHIREDIYDIHKKLPTMNDKIICRKNNWEVSINDEIPVNLVNGLIGYVNSPVTKENIDTDINTVYLDFKPEFCNEDFFYNIPVSTIPFLDLTDKQKKIFEAKQWKYFKLRNTKCNQFEFAYAITVHLSQGSSWKRVFVYDEYYGDDYYNSLYTAITRAEKQVIIAK